MAEVSESRRNNDNVLRMKEDFYTKESETAQKHKAEMKKISEQHQKQIEKLNADHAKEVQQLQGYLRTRLSEKEVEHRDQIQDVRNVYENQIRRRNEEGQSLRDQQKQAYEARLTSLNNT